MADTTQNYYVHDGHPSFDPTSSPTTWTPPAKLTASSLEQLLRVGDHEEEPTTPVSPIMSRRTSVESDRFSTVSGLTTYFPSNPTNVNPRAQYVASFGASQVASEHLSSKRQTSSDEEDDEKLNKDDVQFTERALVLVNAFLDQLLYSFLSTARSTSLLALRPAVTDVLKQRLARDAITSAEEELAELLAGGDDEDEEEKHKSAEETRRWDLELVWKRTRLRVMVYTRLGEMEDDDEQRYVKEEELFNGHERRFSRSSGLVSWAAAIFLTSVLEFVAEQVLQVAGQALYDRARRHSRTQRLAGVTNLEQFDTLVVEEHDVEKIALNSTLGRLWRTWRKTLRNNAANGTPTYRSSMSNGPVSRDNMVSAMSHRRSSFGTAHEGSVLAESRPVSQGQKDDGSYLDFPEHVLAANIPLPIGDHTKDVDEIVVPGLAVEREAGEEGPSMDHNPYPAELLGSLVALPMDNERRDIDEIEIPGLARDPDEPSADNELEPDQPARRLSVSEPLHRQKTAGLPPSDSSKLSPMLGMPRLARLRSNSLPTSARKPMFLDYRNSAKDAAEPERPDHVPVGEAHSSQQEPEIQEPPAVDTEEAPAEVGEPSRDSKHESGSEAFPWMAGGATIATAAVAAAGASIAGSDSDSHTKTGAPGSDDPIDSIGTRDTLSQEEQNPTETLLKTSEQPSQKSYSDHEIEELDRRKSLIDIKAMMIVNGPSGATTGQQSPELEQSTFLSPEDAHSAAGDVTDGVSSEEGPDDAIGIARSADVVSTVIPRMSGEREARESPKRTSDTVLDSAPATASDSPTIKRAATPPHPTSDSDKAQAQYHRSPTKFSNRVSLANGAQQPLAVETSPRRQSLTADVEKSVVVPQRSRSLKGTGHKMSSSKGSDAMPSPKTTKSPRLISDPETLHAMTSASIRGPEDFDMFLQGADTVKYTLTPDTVRDDSVSEDCASLSRVTRVDVKPKQTWNAALQSRSRQAPVEMDATSTKSDSRVGRSQTPKDAKSSHTTAGAAEDEFQNSRRRSISKPPPRNVSVGRKSGLMAREPRVQTNSTRDFADFIRSTGPEKEKPVVPFLPNASQTSLHSLRSAHIHGASASRSSSPTGDRSRSNTLKSDGAPDVPPVPPIKTLPKKAMEPRAAKATTMGSSDLIDFIRSGPGQDGQHRISRSVAPFRTTMDSDQLRDLTDRASIERSSDARLTTSTASVQSPSMRSSQRNSVNSRSALLNGGSSAAPAVQPVRNNQQSKLSTPYESSSVGGPVQENKPTRAQVRNKDPYSMDFLDDDSDDWFSGVPQSSRGEESLLDFLNSNEPPKDNAPRPLLSVDSPQARDAINRMTTNSTNGQQQSINSKTRSTAARSGPASSAPSVKSIRTPKVEARGGERQRAEDSNTRELADFLRSSGPNDPHSAPAPFIGRTIRPSPMEEKTKKKAEKKGMSGFFSSMRRSPKKTYLDMP